MRHILLNDNLSSQTLTCDFSGLSYSASLGSNSIFLSTDTGCKIIYKTENNKSYIVVSDKNTSTVLFEIGENDSTNTSPFTYDLSSDFGTVTTLNTDAYGYTNIHVDESAGNSPICLKPYETVYSTNEMKTGEIRIDGKPIYRKVFYMSDTTTGEKNIDISSLNYEFIMIKNQYFKSKNFIFTGNRYNVNTPNDVIEYFIADNTKQLKINVGTPWTNFETYIVVEYTKTTD